VTVVYDGRDEKYTYPHPGESEADFNKRMEKIEAEIDASMTEEEKRIRREREKGKRLSEILQKEELQIRK